MNSLYRSRGAQGQFQNSNNFHGGLRLDSEARRIQWQNVDRRLLNFIWAHNDWVEKEVLERLNIEDATAVNEALNQIHHNSLSEQTNSQGTVSKSGRSFKDVLSNNGNQQGGWKQAIHRKQKRPLADFKRKENITVFLHGIPEDTMGREIWDLFKSCGNVLDIILPRRRDARGKRYGFLKTTSEKEAGAIISNAKMNKTLGSKIRMSINGK